MRPETTGITICFISAFSYLYFFFQKFRFLSRLLSVVRGVTSETVNMLEATRDESSLDKRIILSKHTFFWIYFISYLLTFPAGRSGCGKSFLLLQVVKHCSSAGWIIIYIPRAVNLDNATTEYLYDIRTQTYLQTKFAFQTLQHTLTVNSELLSSIPLHED